MVEEHFSALFKLFAKHRLKVDLIQNSAISFSVCLDNRFEGFQQLLPDLEPEFKVQYQQNVLLYTIRHANEDSTKTVLQKMIRFCRTAQRRNFTIGGKQSLKHFCR